MAPEYFSIPMLTAQTPCSATDLRQEFNKSYVDPEQFEGLAI
jgi:hypothetical protein